MKNILCQILLLSIGLNAFAQYKDPHMGIIPAPLSIKKTGAEFTFSDNTIIISDAATANEFAFLYQYLKDRGILNKVSSFRHFTEKPASWLELSTDNTESMSEEAYQLVIEPDHVLIKGKPAGLFYGIQTFIQLLDQVNNPLSLPCMVIDDEPRFKYRGLHLDVSRHFFGVAFLEHYLDMMAAYKLNTFHWHLTDDEGWRIEIKKYPKLTSVGSKRAQTRIGSYAADTAGLYDNTPYEGYYTQEQIKEVVAYAAQRHITIVPEIEMPGHSMATIAAYPFLSCDANKKYKVAENWGSFDDVLCPSEQTFTFMENVLKEVIALFPGKYIHIGGDECNKAVWKKSKYCQQLIKDFNLKDEEGLQSYFVRHIEKFVNSKGRSIIGWDEILEGGIAPNATIMSWRGEDGGIAAAKQNHDVIMTPGGGGLYFDHKQSKNPDEPLNIGGFTPLSKTYSYDPLPASLNATQQKYIIGVQANVWTEYISTEAKVGYMLLPRMLALAEIAWSKKEHKNYTDFAETRLPWHLAKIDAGEMDFRVPEVIGMQDTVLTSSNYYDFNLKPSVKGAKIYYTIDGYTPGETDLIYTHPLHLYVPTGKKMTLQAIVITPGGKRSFVTKTVMNNENQVNININNK